MATLRTLQVLVTSDTRKFTKALKTAKTGLAKFKQAAISAASFATKFGVVAGAAAAGGLALLVRNTAQSIDDIAKWSDRLGMATEDLVGLEHAAGLTGVKVNQLRLGLQRMTRRVAEAAQGTGEAQGAIKELGLDAEALARLSPDKQFNEIARAMENVTSQGERVRLAFKLFDSEGVSLVNTLRLGEQGLADVRKEAAALGLTFDRAGAKRAEQMNDALLKMRATFTGLARVITIELAPVVEAGAASFSEWAKSAGGWKNATLDAVEGVIMAISKLSAFIKRAELATARGKQGGSLLAGLLTGGASTAAFTPPTTAEIEKIVAEITRREQDALNAIAKLRVKAAQATPSAARPPALGPRRATDPFPGLFDGSADPTGPGASRAVGNFLEAVKNKAFAVAQAIQPVYEHVALSVKRTWDDVVAAQEEILFKAMRARENAAAFAGAAAGTIKTTLGDAVHDGLANGFDNIGDIMDGFRQRFAQIIIDSFIEAAAGRQIEEAMQGLFGNIFGVGGGTSADLGVLGAN